VLARAADVVARGGLHLLKRRQRRAVVRWRDDRRAQGPERQVRGAEALAAEVRPPVGQQFRHPVELAEDVALVGHLDARSDRQAPLDERDHEVEPGAHEPVLPARHAGVVEVQQQLLVAQHVDVDQASPLRAELLVEPP
jgi:hypothetical protein